MKKEYTTLILTKEANKRLTEARDKYKAKNKMFSNLGLGTFIIILLDEYDERIR